VEFEVAAALYPRPVQVELGGHTWQIRARPAADWVRAITEGGWDDIVPGWLEHDTVTGFLLEDRLEDGTITYADCVAAARDALAATAGVQRWWVAAKLVGALRGEAALAGEVALSGLDLTVAPLGALVQGVYRICVRHATAAQRAKLDFELERIPPGVTAAEVYDEDAAADAFEAFAAGRGVR
jgi:hypothetical protein